VYSKNLPGWLKLASIEYSSDKQTDGEDISTKYSIQIKEAG